MERKTRLSRRDSLLLSVGLGLPIAAMFASTADGVRRVVDIVHLPSNPSVSQQRQEQSDMHDMERDYNFTGAAAGFLAAETIVYLTLSGRKNRNSSR